MNIGYIGIGAAGNKAACELITQGVASESQVLLVNSTNRDFPGWFKGKTIVISPDNGGCGKEREVSKRYMLNSIQAGTFDEILKPFTNVVIVSSMEGGTGSGAAPVLGQYCATVLGKTVRIFTFAGFEDDARGMQNTVEFFQELNYECTVQCLRNSLFRQASKFESEKAANLEFCKEMRVLSGQDMIASSQNMDSTDMDKVVNTAGYCIVDKIEFDQPLMDRTEFDKLCKQMILQSKSLKSEYGQLRMAVILNVRPESEDAIDYEFRVLKETYGQPYESFVHKQYDGEKQYVAYIATGMKHPLDEVKAVYERYKAESAKVAKEKDDFFSAISGLTKNEEDSRFDVGLATGGATTNKEDFLKMMSGTAIKK